MARRDPGRKIAEERLNLGRDAETFIGRPHPCDVLVTRLLGYGEPRPHRHGDELDGGRYDLRHDAGALAAAEDQDAQRPVGVRIGHGGCFDDGRADRISGVSDLGGEAGIVG